MTGMTRSGRPYTLAAVTALELRNQAQATANNEQKYVDNVFQGLVSIEPGVADPGCPCSDSSQMMSYGGSKKKHFFPKGRGCK